MTITSSVTLDWRQRTSMFHYAIAGGFDRTLEYQTDGFISFPAITSATTATSLTDFEALVTTAGVNLVLTLHVRNNTNGRLSRLEQENQELREQRP